MPPTSKAIKWTEREELLVLALALPDNPTFVFNTEEVRKRWPADMPKPTSRAILDRFRLVRARYMKGSPGVPSSRNGNAEAKTAKRGAKGKTDPPAAAAAAAAGPGRPVSNATAATVTTAAIGDDDGHGGRQEAPLTVSKLSTAISVAKAGGDGSAEFQKAKVKESGKKRKRPAIADDGEENGDESMVTADEDNGEEVEESPSRRRGVQLRWATETGE